MKKTALFLSIFWVCCIILTSAQENPGDIWLEIPDNVQLGDIFTFELHLNSGNQRIAAYEIRVIPDVYFLQPDYSDTSNAVEAGKDGFVIHGLFESNLFLCSGFDTSGKGPGTNLHLLTFHCKALKKGPNLLQVKINTLTDENYNTIGVPQGINRSLTISSNGIAGDADQNGSVTIVDALVVAQYYAQLQKTVSLDTRMADVNLDGKVTIVDALIIAQYTVGIVKALPLGSRTTASLLLFGIAAF